MSKKYSNVTVSRDGEYMLITYVEKVLPRDSVSQTKTELESKSLRIPFAVWREVASFVEVGQDP